MYEQYHKAITASGLANNIPMEAFDRFLQSIQPEIRKYRKRQMLYIDGSTLTTIDIVLEGEVILYKNKSDGNRLLLDVLGSSSILGIISILSGDTKRGFNCSARQDCVIMHIPYPKLLTTQPIPHISQIQFLYNLSIVTAQNGAKAFISRYQANARSVREKISNYLFFRTDGVDPDKPTIRVPITITRTELADLLYIPRASLNRELINMKNDGLIDFDLDSITVLRRNQIIY